MPKDVVSDLSPINLEEAYPARFDMTRWDDPYPDDVMKVAHPVAEAFEIARQQWGDEAGTFTPLESGAYRSNYPETEKFVYEPESP